MNTETTETTFEIPAAREGYLASRISDLAARAAKLSLAVVIGFEVLRRFDRETGGTFIDVETGATVRETRPCLEVRVFGEAPRLEGWALRGRFDFASIPGETMRAMVPGYTCPAEFHDVSPHRCDACKVERQRNDTFLLEHEDGRFVVVGRTCLRDYLGHVDPEHVARMAQYLTEISEAGDCDGEFWGSYTPDAWGIDEVLTAAAYSIRTVGWAKSNDWNGSTKDDVFSLLIPPRNPAAAAARLGRLAEITDADRTKARNCAAWLLTAEEPGDYMDNLRAVGRAALVTSKAMGLAVSAIVAYDRAMEREIQRKQRAARKGDSDYVGVPKKRIHFTGLTVEQVRTWQGHYGLTTLVRFRDADSNVLTWFASNCPDVEIGDVFSLRGTVKKHEEFKGEKQTVLTRCTNLKCTANGPARESDVA